MKHAGFALLIYIAAVAQTAVIPRLQLGNAAPEALLALLLPAALIGGSAGVVWAACIGLLADAIGAGGIGPGMLSATIAVWLAHQWLRRHGTKSVPARTVLALLIIGAMLLVRCVIRIEPVSDLRGFDLPWTEIGTATLGSASLVLAGLVFAAVLRRCTGKIAPVRKPQQHAW